MGVVDQSAQPEMVSNEDRTGAIAETVRRTQVRGRLLLTTPALIILFCFASGPLAIMLVYSLLKAGDYGGVVWSLSSDGWANVFLQRDIFDDTLSIADAHVAIFCQSEADVRRSRRLPWHTSIPSGRGRMYP